MIGHLARDFPLLIGKTVQQRLEIPGKPRPWIMAHRGASDLAPENSLAAFELALQHGADLLETDLWFTRDRVLVCHHDRSLARMCGVQQPVGALPLGELQQLHLRWDRGDHPEQSIPTLQELLERVPDEVPIILELKDPLFAEPWAAQRLLTAIEPRLGHRTVGAIAFDLQLLLTLRKQAPGLVLGHISRFNPVPTQPTELLGPFYPLLWANPWYVKMAHRRGIRVCPLDPHLHDHLPRYLRLDVDAVLTNDPRATRARIEALRPLSLRP